MLRNKYFGAIYRKEGALFFHYNDSEKDFEDSLQEERIRVLEKYSGLNIPQMFEIIRLCANATDQSLLARVRMVVQ